MLPRPLLFASCFIVPMFAGWAAREAKTQQANAAKQAASSFAAATAASLTMPAGLDDLAVRMWLAEHLADATGDQLQDIATGMLDVPDLSGKAWSGLFSCWLEKDPAAAWAFAVTREEPRFFALQEWAALDPAAARAAITSPSDDDWLVLVEGAARKDMKATFRLTEEALAAGANLTNLRFDRDHVVYAGLLDFASQDPDATEAWARKLGISPNDLAGVLFLGRWKKDPAAAQEWLSQQKDRAAALGHLAFFARAVDFYQPSLMDFIAGGMPSGNARIEVIEGLLQGLAWRDPDFAGKEASRVIPDQTIRANLIGKIASILADTDFHKAWSLLDTLDPAAQQSDRRDIPQIETSVGSASGALWPSLYYRENVTGGDESFGEVKNSLLYQLMQSDKEEAIRQMDSIPAANIASLARGAFRVWMDHSPEEAIPWLAEKLGTEAGYDKPNIEWSGLEYQLSDLSPEQMLPFIESLPPGTVRTMLTTLHAVELAEHDPLAALRFAREKDTSEHPVTRVYVTLAIEDESKAWKYLSQDPEAPAEAWKSVAFEAFRNSPDEVSEAVLTLPGGDRRDAVIEYLLNPAGGFDPLKAGALAFAVADPAKRASAMEAVLQEVGMDLHHAHDPATADALRAQLDGAAGIPDAERQHWLERINSECTAP